LDTLSFRNLRDFRDPVHHRRRLACGRSDEGRSGGEGWQMVAAYMLMLHGGAAMAALTPRSGDERQRVGHLI
jgi:hypothetical protein